MFRRICQWLKSLWTKFLGLEQGKAEDVDSWESSLTLKPDYHQV
ncbi:MAG: hypothetical protein AB4080_08540 [Trichodesmium sp.]